MTNDNKDMLEAAFKEAYASLNAAQKEAVDSIDGPVMVIAGPGTGKTQILTLRIANILLKTDTAPENILALTFTESGARAMRERLRRYIGSRAYRVPIYTFHGFCGNLIKDYPDFYPEIIGSSAATEMDKIRIIESILDSGTYKLLRPAGNPAYYIFHVLKEFSNLKQEYIGPDRFTELINQQEEELNDIEKVHQKGAHKGKVRGEYTKKEKSIAKNKELLNVYKQYEALLRAERLYDFDDMIIKTIVALESNEDMQRDLQETYQYVLADEHQDVNGAQNRILELLSSYHESPNIFVVGDEKQAIYRFQGASLENFLYFGDLYKNTKTISLTENYRSGQTILDAAHSLVEVEEGPLKDLRIPLNAALVPQSKVMTGNYSHSRIEEDDIVSLVKKEIERGTKEKEIAIILRTNREVEYFAGLLRGEGINATATAEGDVLSHPITKQIFNLISAVVKPEDQSALFKILHGPYWQISNSDFIKVCAAQTYGAKLREIIADKDKLKSLQVEDPDKFIKVDTVLSKAAELSVSQSPQQVLSYLLSESGFVDLVLSTNDDSARVLRRIYDEIESLVVQDETLDLASVVYTLGTYIDHGLALNAPFIITTDDAVQVMTAHKSKGLEFETVFIPNATDSSWGGKTRRRYFEIQLTRHKHDEYDDIDDERRLFYVALTRAKKNIYITSANTDINGKELMRSRLVDEIDESFLETFTTDEVEENFSPVSNIQVKNSLKQPKTDVMQYVLAERGFSATSLNNYLRSPWDYFYRNVLRVPEVQPPHMLFGTAMHGVMEVVTKDHTKNRKWPTDAEIIHLLELQLSRLPLAKEEYVRLHERGLESLLAYVAHTTKSLPEKTEEEKKIRVYLETGLKELPELPLTGMLDRIDFDQDGFAMRVVDYKTGKPKTRNVIEGKTASSDGGYKRQLVFYALLLSLYDDDRYKTKTGVLSFIEPDSKGVIHEQSFDVTDAEIDELKSQIITATKEIVSGQWVDKVSLEDDVTEYKDLAKLLFS